MSKKKIYCAMCGRDLTGKYHHRVWDNEQRKSLPVCAAAYSCEMKFIRRENDRQTKPLLAYRKEHTPEAEARL